MSFASILAFVVYPYVMLTLFVVGHPYRYFTDIYGWNSKSSELLDKDGLKWGVTIFHWGIIGTLFGHAGGMLIPQWFLDLFGFNAERHDLVSHWLGLILGAAAFLGIIMLLIRRVKNPQVRAATRPKDLIVVIFLLIVISAGLYNVLFTRGDILYGVAPWIRSIVILSPDPALMDGIPISYKIHILAALGLLGFSPFTRLVHIWSAPFTYLIRPYLVFRKRAAEIM
jgi:nitrate reductase gamma subunit